jgi:ABC-type multidrug transport system fused ATPase/permease subunit
LVLDEPTAALDAETEHALFERYAAQVRGDGGRVTILVSHRFSTVRMADQIIVLDGSRVVEAGSHDDLMANMRTSTKYKQRRTASSPELDRDVLWVKNGS